jgi:hypothetical protein
MGSPLDLEVRATKIRQSNDRIFGRYEFRFTQGDTVVYRGDQVAMWTRVTES